MREMDLTTALVTVVSWLYLVTNTVRVLFYAPQIRAVCKADDGAASISITTWAFWTFANLTAALYGGIVIRDAAFTWIFAGNFLCTAVVTLVAMVKRSRMRTPARSLR
jgi:hypothetical protein